MRKFRHQFSLQFKLISVVIIAFFATLLASTSVLVASVGNLGRLVVKTYVDEQQLITNHRFAEAEATLLRSVRSLATWAALTPILPPSEAFSHDILVVTNAEGQEIMTMNSPNTLLGDNPQYLRLRQRVEDNKAALSIIRVNEGHAIIALAPIWDNNGQYLGTVTVGDTLDSDWLGTLNFGRSNMALALFLDDNSLGTSASEAGGQPHLQSEQVEALRADRTLLALIRQGETIIQSNIDVRGTPHTVVYHPLFIGGQLAGYYVLAVDEANQQAAERSILVVSLATVLIISVVVGCLIGAALHRFVTRPLHLLSQAAQELAAGHFEIRVQLQSHDEVGQLGETFNDMAVRIEDRTHELDDLNRTLEKRVADRTAQVQQQSAWLEAILCAAREAIIVTGHDRAVRLINAAALDIIGMTEREALGISLNELISRAKGRPVEWPEDADDGHQGEVELKGRYYHCSRSSLSAEQQGGYVCVLTDITPLHRLDSLKTQVIRMASHDLRTPITSLRLQSQLLKRIADPLAEQQARILERLDSSVDDLHQMVNDLLDLERIERQASGLRESVSIQSLLESAVVALASEIENKRHTLEMEIASDLPPGCGDPVLLLEVIRNLLTNAIKYTPAGGRIQVRAFAEREQVCVCVKDNGIGIDAEDMPFVFTPHFRAQSALETVEEGKGIGLSLVKTVVERHGGAVIVDSRRGLGSTFGFSLPVDPSCIQSEVP